MYHETLAMFAAYNAWANARLYEAAAELAPEQFHAYRGVFFESMMGTLNHLLVTDRIWLRRFTGRGEAPDRLDAILFSDFAALRSARVADDRRLVHFVAGLTDAALAGTFTYRTITEPREVTQRLGPALIHVFNHQTHHRGQAHAILTGFGLNAPSLDLIAFQRDGAIGSN